MILPQRREQLAGDVPLEAADSVLFGEALLRASDDGPIVGWCHCMRIRTIR